MCAVRKNSAYRSEEPSEAPSLFVCGVRRPKVESQAELHGLCGALDSLLVSRGELGAFLEHSGSVGSCGKWSILTGLRGWKLMLYCWQGRCGYCGWLASMPQAAKVIAHVSAACQPATNQQPLTTLHVI